MADAPYGSPVLLRFDGLDADDHEMDMADFASSMKGLAKIIGTAGNFAATEKWIQHKDAMEVRVVVRPPEQHCFEIVAWLRWAVEEPLVVTVAGGLVVSLVAYVFQRSAGKSEEMRHLKGALDQAIKELGTRDQTVVDRMLSTIDRMADALRPSARAAVEPIGKSARTLSIGNTEQPPSIILDVADRDAIHATVAPEISAEQDYEIVISELDLQTGSCRFAFPSEGDSRLIGQVIDPLISTPNNPYVIGMAGMAPLKVRAKAALRDGLIEKLYISDVAVGR